MIKDPNNFSLFLIVLVFCSMLAFVFNLKSELKQEKEARIAADGVINRDLDGVVKNQEDMMILVEKINQR